MKKILFVSMIAILFSGVANAQLFEYGIKAGVNFATLPMEDITDIPGDIVGETFDLITGEAVSGYQVGLMTRVNIAMLFIQPEVYFNASKASVNQVIDGTTEALDVNFQRIDIPLLVGAKIGPLRLKGGPVGSAVMSSSGELYNALTDLDPAALADGLTWGFQAGVGVELFGLALDARYEGSLSKYADSFDVSGQTFDFDARPQQWIISLGYWF